MKRSDLKPGLHVAINTTTFGRPYPRADDHPGPREMTIDRAKVTMLRPPGPGVVAG